LLLILLPHIQYLETTHLIIFVVALSFPEWHINTVSWKVAVGASLVCYCMYWSFFLVYCLVVFHDGYSMI
jgi:hypothetical protein